MTELLPRHSRRKHWIFVILVIFTYTVIIWNLSHTQKFTLDLAQKVLEVVEPPESLHESHESHGRFLIDLRNFEYIINQKSCKELKTKPNYIILVHSAPTKRQKRDNIRQTWGGWKMDHLVIFLLGAVASPDVQKEIQAESDFFGDIVQGNFLDTYKNLSYKHVMAMKWAPDFCPEAPFIFKSDDDIFVNTPFISEYIQKIRNVTEFMTCVESWGQPVMREIDSKWYVSPEEFANETYPQYCSGCGVLLSMDVAQKLHKVAETTPFFWVDDVFVLGILRDRAKLKITPVGDLLLDTKTADEIFRDHKRKITDTIHYMFSYELTNEQIRQIWEVVKKFTIDGYYILNKTKVN